MTIYAATKKSMELMAHSYAHLQSCRQRPSAFSPSTALRSSGHGTLQFVDAILKGQPIDIYGEGKMSRDFTYIDDLVEGIIRLSHICACGR